MMKKEDELEKEPKEMKKGGGTGVYAKMAKDINAARDNPQEEGA